VFIRGLEIIKRGSSDFLKRICFEVFHEAFSIRETRILKKIVEDKLAEIPKRDWDPNMFAKSAKYKLPTMNAVTGKMNPGNVSVLRFIDRLKEIESMYPQLNIKCPDVGDRFRYTITKKYPWKYDICGKQVKISKSDEYELLDAMSNKAYIDIVGKLEVNIDYYITNEIIGQFSRFIIYHPDYDPYSTSNMTDEEYKIADKKAIDYTVKELRKFYNSNYASKYTNNGKLHKTIFKEVNKEVNNVIDDVYGPAGDLIKKFKDFNLKATGGSVAVDGRTLFDHLSAYARDEGIKLAIYPSFKHFVSNTNMDGLSDDIKKVVKSFRKYNINIHRLFVYLITAENSYYRVKQRILTAKERDISRKLLDNIGEVQKTWGDLYPAIHHVVNGIKSANKVHCGVDNDLDISYDGVYDDIMFIHTSNIVENYVNNEGSDLDNLGDNIGMESVGYIYNIFCDLVSIHRQRTELEYFKNCIKDVRVLPANSKAKPSSIRNSDLKKDWNLFMERTMGHKNTW